MIYVHLLQEEGNEQLPPHRRCKKFPPVEHVEQPYGVYLPFSSHVLDVPDSRTKYFYRNSSTRREIAFLRRADPSIWWVNKQIGHEAKTLYVTRHMSVDMSGADTTMGDSAQRKARYINRGLHLWDFRVNYEMHDSLRQAITKLELRDWVEISTWVDDVYSEGWDKWTKGVLKSPEGYDFRKFMTVCAISISHNGDMLSVATRLQLEHARARALQVALNDFAGSLLVRGLSSFSGDDIVKCVFYLRTSMDDAWRSGERDTSGLDIDRGEPEVMRFWCFARDHEVDWDEQELIVKEFNYVAASARISEAKAFIMGS